MKFLFAFGCSLLCISAFAQTPDDALRVGWYSTNGTARNIALGGAMGALGGDLSAVNTNPAGAGIYKTSEWLLSPSWQMNHHLLAYRGSDTTSTFKSNMNYGTSGVLFAIPNRYATSGWSSSGLAIAATQHANFANRIQYSGFNNKSSFSEQYLEELMRDGADTNAVLSNYIFGSSLAFRTYLIDTIRSSTGAVAGFQSLVPISTGVFQSFDAVTSGGLHEIAISYAANNNDKLYIGGGLSIPIVHYSRNLVYSETDATNDTTNQFKNFTYQEKFTSTGTGYGIKLGIIYRPDPAFRIGFAFHTPQLISMRDEISSSMVTNTESYAHIKSESSDNLNEGQPGVRTYNISTPYRIIASGSYVFGIAQDVKQQHGFISADVEFVNYRGARFSGKEGADQGTLDYLKLVNNAVKAYYKGNVNIHVGGEIKFSVLMLRFGGAYYGSPYKDPAIQASRWIASGGIGYRNRGMFLDIGYAHQFLKDAQFPYRLNDKPNTYATQKSNIGNLVCTLGFKF